MPTWARVLVIVAGLLLLVTLGVVGLGVYVWRRHGPQFVESSQKAYAEGREYGRHADSQRCLMEAITRHQQAEGFGELIRVNLFLRSCLEAGAPTQGFCDGVPRASELFRSGEWQLEKCRLYGLSTAKQCGQLFAQVQQYCESAQPDSQPETK